MTTQTDDGPPSSGLDLGLVVVAAGLTAAAVVAATYTFWNSPLVRGPSAAADGARTPPDADTRTTDPRAGGRAHAHAQDVGGDAAARGVRAAEPHKARNRKRKSGAGNAAEVGDADGDGDEDEDEGKGKGKGDGQGQRQGKVKGKGRVQARPLPEAAIAVAVPGAFEAAVESPDAVVVAASHSPAWTGTASKPGDGDKTEDKTNKKRKKKKHVQQSKVRDRDGEDSREEETEAGDGGVEDNARSKTDREVPATAHSARQTGDSTDTDASPSVSASTSTSIRAVGKGSIRASTRAPPSSELHVQQQGAHAPSQAARESRPLHLLFDTDGSWTHVGRHHRSSKSSRPEDGDGRSGHPVDAIDVASSDLASTESSGSPIAERTIESIAGGGRDTRADLAPRTLAEKLIPKPEKIGVEDMLERPDVPTSSRVVRVQPPRANEGPMLGFSSWEDSGDLGDESLLVHDADQEDEGEWDIVKSRHRTQPTQTTTTTITTITNTTASTPETMTKRQRQNARKRELAKSAKADAETARQEGLERHKRELERLRIIEQAHRGGSGTGGGKRQPSGGMRAAVDDRGKLVWE